MSDKKAKRAQFMAGVYNTSPNIKASPSVRARHGQQAEAAAETAKAEAFKAERLKARSDAHKAKARGANLKAKR